MVDIDSNLTVEFLVKDTIVLFSLPDIYLQIEKMIADPRFTATDIGEVIAKDPALSLRLLKIVNSSMYGFQSRIDTISRAVTIVGVDDLQSLVLATSVVSSFDSIDGDLVDMTDFWLKSINCGVIARLLAKKSGVLHSERLFLAGLLHNIGSLLMYQKIPAIASKILEISDYNPALIAGIEQELLGFTFADVGGELAKLWELPEALCETIAYQLTPEISVAHSLDAQILYVATVFANNLVFDQAVVDGVWATLPKNRRNLLQINTDELLLLLEQAQVDVEQFFELIGAGRNCL